MTERLSGHTLMLALIATPIRHSLSPKMYNETYAKLGLDLTYLAFEVGQEELPDAAKAIRALGIVGGNVSMPNKQAIVPYMDELSPAAKMIGAVNTFVNKDGHLIGHNTDGVGAVRALEAEGIDVEDQVITLAGIGGAGTAIAVQLGLEGAKEVRIFNIKDKAFDAAASIVDTINTETQTKVILEDLSDTENFYKSIGESSIYIDATGIGMKPFENMKLINDPAVIRPDLVILDVVYSPAETQLLKFARENGCQKAFNGLSMMLYQGAAAFKLHTGEDMPVDYIRELLFEK
ncbi:bifunctional 3-dehydroquinate dehydratase/shikimate dehydrogenase protein [Chlamydia trachomatis]|nr:bifunctional 3-dehydroquinate dehydratase/shikimate dehydrogenase protein [Chlamydia trachomatis]CRH89797.1 bifunctional 3-dehydroquinate dehydratase/shikimate dehydrogenase protein [Chlamydia trachomatis]